MSDWKFDVDEVGEDAEDHEDPDAPDERLEPGSPTSENVLFVALGVAVMLFVFAQVVLLAVG